MSWGNDDKWVLRSFDNKHRILNFTPGFIAVSTDEVGVCRCNPASNGSECSLVVRRCDFAGLEIAAVFSVHRKE